MTGRLLAMFVVVALAGCSAPDEPDTRATTTSPPAASESTSPPSPPAITRPLDASAYRHRACDLLTRAQIAAHHMTSVENVPELTGQRGAACLMDGPDPHASITLRYLYAIDLLGAVHRQELPWLPAPRPFEPATVAGQPALQGASSTECDLAIGLTDTQGVVVSFHTLDSPPDPDPCARATAAGEDIVRNLAG